MKMLLAITTILPMLVSADVALAGSLSGNWPLTVTHSQNNGKNCLTLKQEGRTGGQPSGLATIPGEPYGTFQVIGHTLVAAIEEQGGTGQNAGLVFTATVSNGTLGRGITVTIYGGEAINSGLVTFGMKGGC